MSQNNNHSDDNRKLFLIFTLVITVGAMIFFKQQVGKAAQVFEETQYKEYSRYYAMIVEDSDSAFWQAVYKGACQSAEENDACVELVGSNLAVEYSREERMHIAIESKADGIIVQADESDEMTALIDEAVDNGIPVVTVLGDNTAGRRQSFVGVGSYNLGREYGRQVLELCRSTKEQEAQKVFVLMDMNAKDTSQNILYSGIQEMIADPVQKPDITLEMRAVNNKSAFSAEESIRDIFMDTQEKPDIIICLDATNTSCVYQAVVDYNKVGEVGVIGYYDSEATLRAIERDVIYSTITIDTAQMGSYCVEALDEFYQTGNVSEYFSVDTYLVNRSNVAAYLAQEYEDGE